jgi:hypothetical protein
MQILIFYEKKGIKVFQKMLGATEFCQETKLLLLSIFLYLLIKIIVKKDNTIRLG